MCRAVIISARYTVVFPLANCSVMQLTFRSLTRACTLHLGNLCIFLLEAPKTMLGLRSALVQAIALFSYFVMIII